MTSNIFSCLVFSLGISITSLSAQQIFLDEDFSDWSDIEALYTDSGNDNQGIDFGVLKVTNDDRFIYFYLEVGEEINLQDLNGITLYIDTDNDSETGVPDFGIGYDFEFTFGEREGTFHGAQTSSINAYEIGLVSSPTVTSTVFELKLNLDAEIDGQPLFTSQTIQLVFKSEGTGGDSLPESNELLSYNFSQEAFDPLPFQLHKKSDSDIRILSYNVLRDNLFNSEAENHFRRIFQAIQPDIIGLSEVYDNSGTQAAALIETFLPSGEGEQWFSGDTGNDNLMVSRYPILEQTSIDGNAAFLLDLGDRNLFTIVAHPPCCANNEGRQQEFDAMMGFLRDSQNGQEFDIQANTPIIIMGDMNLVGFAQQQVTLLTGDIDNEQQYGADFNPDWDGTDLEDAMPANPGLPTTFTWYDEGSSFSAGRLDYIVYSGSVLEMVNSFSLHTPDLDTDTLTAYGLEAEDTIEASDHLPLVADFRLPELTSNETNLDSPRGMNLQQNYPNPFNPSTNITYELADAASITLTVLDSTGRKVATLLENKMHSAGSHEINFDAENLASGVYIYQLAAGAEIITKKMVLVK